MTTTQLNLTGYQALMLAEFIKEFGEIYRIEYKTNGNVVFYTKAGIEAGYPKMPYAGEF